MEESIDREEERIFEVLRNRSKDLAEAILKAIEANEDLALRFATSLSKRITVPLNVATKEDLKALEAVFKAEISRIDQRITNEASRLDQRITDLENTLKSEISRIDQRITGETSKLDHKITSEIAKLDQKISKIDRRLTRVERTLENITISIEEEARKVVAIMLKDRGLSISISSLMLDKKYEIDLYGVGDGMVIVGDAKTRASEETVSRLLKRVEKARKRWPEKFKGKIIVTLYCLKYIDDPEKAEGKGVWLIESTRELTKISI